jgi:hypothetical protein
MRSLFSWSPSLTALRQSASPIRFFGVTLRAPTSPVSWQLRVAYPLGGQCCFYTRLSRTPCALRPCFARKLPPTPNGLASRGSSGSLNLREEACAAPPSSREWRRPLYLCRGPSARRGRCSSHTGRAHGPTIHRRCRPLLAAHGSHGPVLV